ncbi:unnamed protein product [Heterobilharzia americana]|nr:unnamed protein product [Heterobilharzia americana]
MFPMNGQMYVEHNGRNFSANSDFEVKIKDKDCITTLPLQPPSAIEFTQKDPTRILTQKCK